MFDATLNGVLDSADAATDMILSDILTRRQTIVRNPERTVVTDVLSLPPGLDEVRDLFLDGELIADLMNIVWEVTAPAKILIVGSGSGKTVGALRSLRLDAWGIENDVLSRRQTPEELQR